MFIGSLILSLTAKQHLVEISFVRHGAGNGLFTNGRVERAAFNRLVDASRNPLPTPFFVRGSLLSQSFQGLTKFVRRHCFGSSSLTPLSARNRIGSWLKSKPPSVLYLGNWSIS